MAGEREEKRKAKIESYKIIMRVTQQLSPCAVLYDLYNSSNLWMGVILIYTRLSFPITLQLSISRLSSGVSAGI